MSMEIYISVIKYVNYMYNLYMSDFDIVGLIEENPITKLSGDYHNKLITKIKETFNDGQQQMFVASFLVLKRENDRV